MLEELAAELRAYYELDDLFAADVDGQIRWVVRTVSGWRFGDVVGPLFADAVLAAWDVLYPGTPDTWTV